MQHYFLLSQFFMGFNLLIIPLKQKTKTKNEYFKYSILQNFFDFGQNICLFATSAMCVDVANSIFALIAMKRHSISKFSKLLLILGVLIFTFFITPKNLIQWYWYIPVILFPISKISQMFLKMKHNRIIFFILGMPWVLFEYEIGSPVGIIASLFMSISSAYYVIKYRNL